MYVHDHPKLAYSSVSAFNSNRGTLHTHLSFEIDITCALIDADIMLKRLTFELGKEIYFFFLAYL